MIDLNVRKNESYYSQINNTIRPYGTCNTTSMIMGLDYSNVPFPANMKYDQPEDDLTNFMLTDPRVDAKYKELFPTEYANYIASGKDPKKTYPPNELHAVLAYGTNLWLGKNPDEAVKFRLDLSVQEVVFEFVKGKAVVQSGLWGKLHHITCFVGCRTTQDNIASVTSPADIDVSQIQYMVMEDPYGDYHNNYDHSDNGKDIHVPYADYIAFVQNLNTSVKWGHIFLE